MAAIRVTRTLRAPAAQLDRFLPAASHPVQEAMAEAEMGGAPRFQGAAGSI
jgi:hypothetical protein